MQHNVLLNIPLFDDIMLNLFDWRVGVVSVPLHRAGALIGTMPRCQCLMRSHGRWLDVGWALGRITVVMEG